MIALWTAVGVVACTQVGIVWWRVRLLADVDRRIRNAVTGKVNAVEMYQLHARTDRDIAGLLNRIDQLESSRKRKKADK